MLLFSEIVGLTSEDLKRDLLSRNKFHSILNVTNFHYRQCDIYSIVNQDRLSIIYHTTQHSMPPSFKIDFIIEMRLTNQL